MELYNNDCLDIMNTFESESIDFVFCDLPYGGGHTACSWDKEIDLERFWKIINKITKKDAPIIFTCSTKFGVKLINSNPKNFRYDLVWVKSSPCGFLNAKKMPMKKHEMIYVFYRKLPKVYTENIKEHHKHKFLEERDTSNYKVTGESCYGKVDRPDLMRKNGESKYDPPLPTSVVKNEEYENRVIKPRNTVKIEESYGKGYLKKKENFRAYNPKLGAKGEESNLYEPPLPTSVLKTQHNTAYGNNIHFHNKQQKNGESIYEPPLPNTILEIKNEKGKHPTQKPTELVKWLLKYYTKEGDKVLDPTMGSGTTGVACKKMNREFIGIEKDEDIFKIAESRLI